MLSDKASLMNVPETMVAPPLESGKCTTSVEYIDPIMLSISTASASGWVDSILLSGSSVSRFSVVWYPELSLTDGECSVLVLDEDSLDLSLTIPARACVFGKASEMPGLHPVDCGVAGAVVAAHVQPACPTVHVPL